MVTEKNTALLSGSITLRLPPPPKKKRKKVHDLHSNSNLTQNGLCDIS